MFAISEFTHKTDELVALLKRMIEIESPTGDKAAVDRLGSLLLGELHRLGAQVEVAAQTEAGDHVIARWGRGRSGILLLAHMDTVHPTGTLAANPCIERDRRLYGPGSQDMKGGIALFLGAARWLQEQDHWPARPITTLLTSDEETGSRTSRPLIEALARESDLALCLEPCLPDGGLKTWRKGVGDFELIAHGRASHAGAAHAEGRNAIAELAHQILRVQAWTDYERGTTLNVGLIQGGTAANVVPEEARAVVDLRIMTPEEGERVIEQLQDLRPALEGTTIEVQGGINRPPMPRDARMIATFEKAREIARGLGLELQEGGTGGGSDANFVAPLGVPVLDGLGPLGAGQHTLHEYVEIDSLPERAALLAALLAQW